MLLIGVSHADKVPVVQIVTRTGGSSINLKNSLPFLAFECATGRFAKDAGLRTANAVFILILAGSESDSNRLLVKSADARSEAVLSVSRQQVPP